MKFYGVCNQCYYFDEHASKHLLGIYNLEVCVCVYELILCIVLGNLLFSYSTLYFGYLFLFLFIYFRVFILFLISLYSQDGARTQNPEIKNCMLHQLSQPGAPGYLFLKVHANVSRLWSGSCVLILQGAQVASLFH